jgi:hypothetical protein
VRKYDKISFEEQIDHEKKKHSQDEYIQKTKKREAQRLEHIKLIKKFFPSCKRILCVGARDDSEVQTFIKHGYEAHGLDIAVHSDYIWQIDAHKLCGMYKGPEHDVTYCSHSLEHMFDAKKVLRCIRKIAQMGIFIILPIYDKNRGMDASHCTIFDIMINPDDSTLSDFWDLHPYNLLHFKKYEKQIEFILGWIPEWRK